MLPRRDMERGWWSKTFSPDQRLKMPKTPTRKGNTMLSFMQVNSWQLFIRVLQELLCEGDKGISVVIAIPQAHRREMLRPDGFVCARSRELSQYS